MATTPISKQALIDAQTDADSISAFANAPVGDVNPRYGGPYPNIRKLISHFMMEFDATMLLLGYEDVGDYAAGITLTRRNQVFRRSGEYYKLAAAIDLPYTTTGSWAGESTKFVAMGDAVLRQELATALGSSMIGTKIPFNGGALRTLEQRLSVLVTPNDFGAIGDKQYHPLSERYATLALAQAAYPSVPITSLSLSIDWAACWACFNFAGRTCMVALPGVYVLNDTIELDFPPKLMGPARNREWSIQTTVANAFSFTSGGFLSYGDFPKRYTVLGVTDCANSGGEWANPDQAFGLDSKYNLATYYNADGTPRLISAMFKFKFGSNSADWTGVTVCKGFNGVEGYTSKANGWGDKVDVGVYMDNSRHNTFTDCQFIGYWDINGVLIRSGALDTEPDYAASGTYSGGEENKFTNCVFQGWKSLGLRSIDMYKAIEVSPDYIGIPYKDGLPFTQHMRLRVGEFGTGAFFTLSSLLRVGDVLRLYTVGSTVGKVSVGNTISPSYHGNGVAGTVFRDCRAMGMNHAINRRCSDTWHTTPLAPSACVEISGTRIRGIRWETSKTQTVDDIAIHAHQTIDLMMPGLRLEGNPDVNGIGGVRMLSTNVDYPHYVRELYRTQYTIEQAGADMRPAPSERPNKFPTEITGMWRPTLFGLDGRHGVFIGGFLQNHKLDYFNQGGFTVVLQASDGDLALSGVARHGSTQSVGNRINVQFSYYAGTASYSAGNGQLQMTLPVSPEGFTGSIRIPVIVEGGAFTGSSASIEITAGSTTGKFYARKVGQGTSSALLAKDVFNTGANVRISGVLTYQRE